ncbi:hypothetical protein [Niastella sp. OAS944]|uniref:hypothetical protein n=1 Tax=Niastella sp. OAS944 TaxID=2664089 RepID=UPI00348796FB|nr:hypothetical protein [Chitinophagaceae bacterium OAS944]
MQNYIELNRTFYQLPSDYGQGAKTDDIDIKERLDFRIGNTIAWDGLLKEYRVILLAEAGAGKTQEIRHITQKLIADSKFAFFLRLEHITADFDTAFEEGSFQEFKNWLHSNEEGWIFLDSVDEARLKNIKDFESAIKKLSSQISPALQRAHILITSRVTAWRPNTDLSTCNLRFPFLQLNEQEVSDSNDGMLKSSVKRQSITKKHKEVETDNIPGFKIYSLTDLSRDQICRFARAKNIIDDIKFLEEIERQDAWAFTTRPQDLEEIIEFWTDQKRIGTRLELMKHSVARRIKERDEDRAESNPLSLEKAREGVLLLAAACTLLHKSTIRVPDGANNSKGIDAKSILSGWNDKECQILLSRPIFDEAIYGSVRFHHRSVREYLTAEWLFELLKKAGSRQKIEDLLFRNQYGMQVVIPSMKPVLSWLVLFDDKIMQKVYNIEPEIILEGGDPSKLPLETRKDILQTICEKISLGTSSKEIGDHSAVQRFASEELSDEIKKLMCRFKTNNNVLSYLLRMIWQGRIKEALPESKSLALNPLTEKYNRTAAIRATKEIGANEDFSDILKSFGSEKSKHDRRVLAEIIALIDSTEEMVTWIFEAIENTQDKKRHEHDGLSQTLLNFVERSELEVIPTLIKGIDKLLQQKPFIERRYCEISEKFGWLMPIGLKAVEKLIINRHPFSLSEESLFIFTLFPAFQDYRDFENSFINQDISILITEWNELNHRLFWKSIEETRKVLYQKNEEPLINYWQIFIRGSYWKFSIKDINTIINDITIRDFLDDKLVALSLAFQLYKENDRPKKYLAKLKKATLNNEALEKRLKELLHPPAQSPAMKRLRQQQAQWDRRDNKLRRRQEEDHIKSTEWLRANYQELRNNGLEKGLVSNSQRYVYERMRDYNENSSKWTNGNWQSLIKEYGVEVATAFHDGLLAFWRNYTPYLRSEKVEKNKIPFAVLFGLSGLEVESLETKGWPSNLNDKEAELACRYALEELNDFPHWFSNLYNKFPRIVIQLLLKEIDWELSNDKKEEPSYYIISKVSWNCEWMWNDLAPSLFKKMENECLSGEKLGHALKIIQGSSTVSENELCELAARKCNTLTSMENLSYWYATWIGIDPENSIKTFATHLANIDNVDQESAKNLAMQVLVNLVGDRKSETRTKENYKTASYLKSLYLLMHQYIKVTEDLDRFGKGAYSPTLRDDAQEARSRLFAMLREIPGKESYLAMVELSKSHPVMGHRVWMMNVAKERAELDADISPWSIDKFNEFTKSLESTPVNPRELFDLAVQRLLDLKHDLEDGDTSIAPILLDVTEETKIRNYVGGWCRDRSQGKYSVPQEEEFSDSKRSDIRFLGSGFDCAIPIELKLADNNWSGAKLQERLENQLCGDYLRDKRSPYGIFLLVYRGEKVSWEIIGGNRKAGFSELIEALQQHWQKISIKYPNIEEVKVIGIDLTKRIQFTAPKTKGK